MSLTADILTQTTIANPLPVIVRGTTNQTTDYFIKLKDYYIMWTGATGIMYLLKTVNNVLTVVKTLPCPVTNNVPFPLGNNNAFVTKDCANCSITLNFIDPLTDEITQTNICVSTATEPTKARESYAIDVIDTTIYVAVMESASCFLYTGTVNMVNKSVVFTKKTIKISALTAIGNWVENFTMVTPTYFTGVAYTNATQATSTTGMCGFYNISNTTITYVAGSAPASFTATNNVSRTYPRIHTASGTWVYDGSSLYYLNNMTVSLPSVTVNVGSGYANVGIVLIDGVPSNTSYINMGQADGMYYALKDNNTYDMLTTNNMIPQAAANTTYNGIYKYGPIINNTLLTYDPYNVYNYISTAVTFTNNVISPGIKRVKAYTNISKTAQYITGVALTSMMHQIDLKYSTANTTAFRNCVGISINGKTLYRKIFDQSDVHTFANCPIVLHPGDTVYLDVVTCYGDVTLTLFGLRDGATYTLDTTDAQYVTVNKYNATAETPITMLANGAAITPGTVLRFMTSAPTNKYVAALRINGALYDLNTRPDYVVGYSDVVITTVIGTNAG